MVHPWPVLDTVNQSLRSQSTNPNPFRPRDFSWSIRLLCGHALDGGGRGSRMTNYHGRPDGATMAAAAAANRARANDRLRPCSRKHVMPQSSGPRMSGEREKRSFRFFSSGARVLPLAVKSGTPTGSGQFSRREAKTQRGAPSLTC